MIPISKIAAAMLAATPIALIAQDVMTLQPMTLSKTVTQKVDLKYWLSLPKGYASDTAKKWPLMLFLHGAGERGDDLEKVKKHGPPKLITAGADLPFIVVAPQCPADAWWESTAQVIALATLIDEIQASHRVDADRVYCTGISMGGYGTWRLACEYPRRFAAVVPICGGGRPFLARAMKDVAAWVFHGAKDPVVPLSESEKMVEALKRAGGSVEFTVYPEALHDSWTETYDNPAVFDWLLKHRRAP